MSSLGFECLNVRYGSQEAVFALTDTVRPGEWLCLIGPNGAGKSSALRAVAGIVPYRGTITVDGAPLAMRSPRRRAAIVAYVPQSPLMPDDMTGAEYVLLGRNPYVGYFGQETAHDRALVRDVLDFTVALCNPRGEIAMQGVGMAIHLGALPASVEAILRRFGDRIVLGGHEDLHRLLRDLATGPVDALGQELRRVRPLGPGPGALVDRHP